MSDDPQFCDEDIHEWFGLSYCNYLVLQRALLQSMPGDWQHRFVECLREIEAAYAHLPVPSRYSVQARGEGGRFMKDPIPHYNRGRTRLEPQVRTRAEVLE